MGAGQARDRVDGAPLLAADQHEAALPPALPERAHELHAVHARHVEVTEDQLDRRQCGIVEPQQRIGGVRTARDAAIAAGVQRQRQDAQQQRLVVEQQDFRVILPILFPVIAIRQAIRVHVQGFQAWGSIRAVRRAMAGASAASTASMAGPSSARPACSSCS